MRIYQNVNKKKPSNKIVDVETAKGTDYHQDEIGIRPGEKLHEEMITVSDALNTYDIGKYFVILQQNTVFNGDKFIEYFNERLVDFNFSYNSADNEDWEIIKSLRGLVKTQVVTNFTV